MVITQVISSPVSLPTPPNPATDEEQEFDDKAYPYTVAQNEFGLDMQQISSELNNFAIQANALGLEVSINATNAANSATTAQQQVVLAENFADAAAISANDAQNSAISSQTWALESLESAGIAAAAAGLNFGGFYVLDGELYAEYNNLAIATIQLVDGEFIVELI